MNKDNFTILSRHENVAPFYNEASIVLNLSDRLQFVETFGLTALEAMSAGLPVIVPTEGGIAEMVDDEVNGFKIDVQELYKIKDCIQSVLSDKALYISLSEKALEYSNKFNESEMTNNIMKILEK